jgi:hypothetical protein
LENLSQSASTRRFYFENALLQRCKSSQGVIARSILFDEAIPGLVEEIATPPQCGSSQ